MNPVEKIIGNLTKTQTLKFKFLRMQKYTLLSLLSILAKQEEALWEDVRKQNNLPIEAQLRIDEEKMQVLQLVGFQEHEH